MRRDNVVPFKPEPERCDTCGRRGGTFCWFQQKDVPDDYVCSEYFRRGLSIMWKPGDNEEGD